MTATLLDITRHGSTIGLLYKVAMCRENKGSAVSGSKRIRTSEPRAGPP